MTVPTTTAPYGDGSAGYASALKEAFYGTAPTESTDASVCTYKMYAVDAGGDINGYNESIEREGIIGSRTEQDPEDGRAKRPVHWPITMYPTDMGQFLNWFGGLSANAADVAAYDHVWLANAAAARVGTSVSVVMYKGNGSEILAEKVDGCTFTKMTIAGDTTKSLKVTLDGFGQGFTTGIAKKTTFVCPAERGFNWGDVTWSFAIDGGGTPVVYVDSFSLVLNTMEDTDRYVMTNAVTLCEPLQPVSDVPPSVELTLALDADYLFIEAARNRRDIGIVFTAVHTLACASGKYYTLTIELPKLRIPPEVTVPLARGRQKISLTMKGYAHATTNSAGVAVLWEVRWKDAVATYSAT